MERRCLTLAIVCRDPSCWFIQLFDWLVLKINLSIKKDGFQGIQIGVLDVSDKQGTAYAEHGCMAPREWAHSHFSVHRA
jgi:hypothetical protein